MKQGRVRIEEEEKFSRRKSVKKRKEKQLHEGEKGWDQRGVRKEAISV